MGSIPPPPHAAPRRAICNASSIGVSEHLPRSSGLRLPGRRGDRAHGAVHEIIVHGDLQACLLRTSRPEASS